MKKHVMAITYAPKEDAVRLGDCRQTIRKGDKVSVGDEILFHGWSGRPYRSPWSWRRQIYVEQVVDIEVSLSGIVNLADPMTSCAWNSRAINHIAKYDFIDPPTGVALRDVLFGHNSRDVTASTYQIIRW